MNVRVGRKEVRELLAELERDGWEVVRQHKHIMLRHASGARLVISKTGDRRSVENSRKDARRLMRRPET